MLERKQSVLIVDGSEDTREVLRTALERRGVKIFEAVRAEQALELARQHHPDLIVLDLEVESNEPGINLDGFHDELSSHSTPMVLLGSARRNQSALPAREFVSKPYHYGPLIRRIEMLLSCHSSERQLPQARCT